MNKKLITKTCSHRFVNWLLRLSLHIEPIDVDVSLMIFQCKLPELDALPPSVLYWYSSELKKLFLTLIIIFGTFLGFDFPAKWCGPSTISSPCYLPLGKLSVIIFAKRQRGLSALPKDSPICLSHSAVQAIKLH